MYHRTFSYFFEVTTQPVPMKNIYSGLSLMVNSDQSEKPVRATFHVRAVCRKSHCLKIPTRLYTTMVTVWYYLKPQRFWILSVLIKINSVAVKQPPIAELFQEIENSWVSNNGSIVPGSLTDENLGEYCKCTL